MITLLCAACFSAVGVGCLSLLGMALWPYYVPIALALVLAWLHFLDLRNRYVARGIVRDHPDLLTEDERELFACSPSVFVPPLTWMVRPALAGYDLLPVLTTMEVAALLYSLGCVVAGSWGPAVLSGGLLVYALLGPLASAFETWNVLDTQDRAVGHYLRYLRRRRRLQARDVSRTVPAARDRYTRVRRKLEGLLAEQGSRSGPHPSPWRCRATRPDSPGRWLLPFGKRWQRGGVDS